MGMIGRILGGAGAGAIGAVGEVAEIFTENATERMQAESAALAAAMGQLSAEFAAPSTTWFDVAMNGANRLPRPFLALGTLGLFVHAMVDPEGFAVRMRGLEAVPEPLWWLLGAIVSFYFGAREAHYYRARKPAPQAAAPRLAPRPAPEPTPMPAPDADLLAPAPNEALMDFMARRNRARAAAPD